MLRSDLIPEFREIIPEGEYIVWATSPNFSAFVLPSVLLFIGAALYSVTVFDVVVTESKAIFIHILSVIKSLDTSMLNWGDIKDKLLEPSLNFSVLIKTLPIVFCTIKLFFAIKSHSHTYYAKTNKRLIFKEGSKGQAYTSIYLDKITKSQISVSIYDVTFRTGSIEFYTGLKDSDGDFVSSGVMKSIPNPNAAYREIHRNHN